MDDTKNMLETQTFNLFPERWNTLYFPDHIKDLVPADDYEEEVTSIDDLDRFFDQLEAQHTMTGEEAFQELPERWGEWF